MYYLFSLNRKLLQMLETPPLLHENLRCVLLQHIYYCSLRRGNLKEFRCCVTCQSISKNKVRNAVEMCCKMVLLSDFTFFYCSKGKVLELNTSSV